VEGASHEPCFNKTSGLVKGFFERLWFKVFYAVPKRIARCQRQLRVQTTDRAGHIYKALFLGPVKERMVLKIKSGQSFERDCYDFVSIQR
jgi:hypothetical protein